VPALNTARAGSSPQNAAGARGTAFTALSEQEALKSYPELKRIYDFWRDVEKVLKTRYPEDEASRKMFQEKGRAGLVRLLNEGTLPGEQDLKRAMEIVSGVKRPELDR
jgi:hypothetical protein